MDEMRQEAKDHHQHFDRSQLIIPRLNILQDLSPQIKERRAEYVPGAKSGHIYNNVAGTIDEEITFIPAKFSVRYIAWKINRGGLVDQNLTLEEVEENFEPAGLGMWSGMMSPRPGEPAVQVEVIETPEWVGIAKGDGWGPMPVAISFPITKAKTARKINTAIDMNMVEDEGGDFRVPIFYNKFTLKTAIEQSGENEWFGWSVQHHGKDYAQPRYKDLAKELKIAFDEGKTEVDESGAVR